MSAEGTSNQTSAPAAGPHSSMQQPPLNLLDLPAPWLDQLPAAVGRDIVPLLCCCRALRDLVLSQRRVLVEYDLPIPPDEEAAAQIKLLTACRYSENVRLTFDGLYGDGSPYSASHLLISSMAAAGQALTAITSVTIKNLHLDALVPPWLITTCPNMSRLEVVGVDWVNLHAPTATIPMCPQLKELDISVAQILTDKSRWQHQLRALPGLTSLTNRGREQMQILECCSLIGSQLTHLHLPASASVQLQLTPQMAAWFPRVCHLQLSSSVVDDGGMEGLLSMHGLRKLQCKGFRLQHSYTHRACPWTHLSVTHLDVASFDRLPLNGVHCTEARVSTIIASRNLDANARVAAAAARCGIECDRLVRMDMSNADSDCLAALMPMFCTCKAEVVSVLSVRHVTPELLAAMGQHLSRSKVHTLHFGMCEFLPDVWPLLLPSLPSVATVHFGATEITEVQLTEMCVHACRPVVVEIVVISRLWRDGWQQRVQAAMAAAAHQHVALVTL